jgi:Ca2+-binding RTX toxin-like protein
MTEPALETSTPSHEFSLSVTVENLPQGFLLSGKASIRLGGDDAGDVGFSTNGSHGPTVVPLTEDQATVDFLMVKGQAGEPIPFYVDSSAYTIGFSTGLGVITSSPFPADRNYELTLTFDYIPPPFSDRAFTLFADMKTSLTRTAEADTLGGTQFKDELYGLGGRDTLTGAAGQDSLYGGDDADHLRGGADDDLLDGEHGNDKLWGGEGNDTFVHRVGDGRDKVMDFGLGDVLALRGYTIDGRDLAFADLDSNGDGLLNGHDANVSIRNGDLTLRFASFSDEHADSVKLRHVTHLDSSDLVFG